MGFFMSIMAEGVSMLEIAVCDDNREEVDFLSGLIENSLKKRGANSRVDCFTSGEELLENLRRKKEEPDIVFMDIQLENENGIQLAGTINGAFPRARVIFMTGHVSYAQDIFDARPTYFLLKPITENKLADALDAAVRGIESDESRTVAIISKGHIFKLRIDHIDYITSDRRIAFIHEKNRITKIYAKLDDLEKPLGGKFLRCHQSYIVNMDRVRSFDSLSLSLYSGKVIPVSKKRYAGAKSAFLKYVGESL